MSPQQQGYMGGAGGPNQNAPWGQFGMMNDATAQMGMQFGRSAVAAGQDYVNKNVSAIGIAPVIGSQLVARHT